MISALTIYIIVFGIRVLIGVEGLEIGTTILTLFKVSVVMAVLNTGVGDFRAA